MKKVYHANIDEKKARVAMLKLGKVDFRANEITRDRKGLCNTKRLNPPRRHHKPKMCMHKQQSFKVCKAKADLTKSRNKQKQLRTSVLLSQQLIEQLYRIPAMIKNSSMP